MGDGEEGEGTWGSWLCFPELQAYGGYSCILAILQPTGSWVMTPGIQARVRSPGWLSPGHKQLSSFCFSAALNPGNWFLVLY